MDKMIVKELKKMSSDIKREIKRLQSKEAIIRGLLDDPARFETARRTYRVSVHSFWEDHGGKSIKYSGTGKLAAVVRRAIEKFANANNSKFPKDSPLSANLQSKLQAAIGVSVIFEGKVGLSIPEKYYLCE